jgi:hypothetical protein
VAIVFFYNSDVLAVECGESPCDAIEGVLPAGYYLVRFGVGNMVMSVAGVVFVLGLLSLTISALTSLFARAQSISGEGSRLDPEIEHVVLDAAAEAPASPAEGNTRSSDSVQNS